ncbi:MAG: extracellular solute-binding protein [Anaerolineales bacterium]|nr:extracellular solute-binding protein [Anaerolineales bacterium]
MFGRFFNWRGRQRPFTCNDIEARLVMYEDGRLLTQETAAFEAHLSGCEQCRQLVQAGPGWLAELREAPAPVRLTRAERREMQQALAKRMRRKMIMQDFRLSLQNVVAVAAVLLIVGGLVWWQTADFSQPEDEPAATTEPAATRPAESGDAVTVTLAVESGTQARYQPLVDAFEQEHPHIQVRLVSVNDVANPDEDGIRALASSFDVFPYSPNRQGDTQYLLDLRPFLTLDPDFDAADFYPSLLPAAPETLYAMPTGAAYYLIYFDKTAFDAVERPYPALAWTTDEFLETAVALTAREGDEVIRWGYVPAQMRYAPLLAAQLNAPMQTADGLRLQDPDVAAALGWVSALFTEYKVAPWLDEYRPADRRGGGDPSPTALIADGRAALWHTTHLLYDVNEANVGVTAVPQGDYGLAAEPLIFGFAASRGTTNPEAAWELLDFLSRQPPQESAFQISPVPARRSVAAATNFWAQLPPELAPALQYSADNSAAPRIPAQAVDPLMTAFAAQIDDGVDTAVALDQLELETAVPPEQETEVVAVPTVPAQDDAATTRITFVSSFSFMDAHRRLASQFVAENPAIQVTIIEPDDDTSTPLQRVGGGDCFLGSTQILEDEEARTALLQLDPLLALDDVLQVEDFYPVMVEPFLHDGQLWGIPAGASAPYLEYNAQIFEDAGLPLPPLEWTLDDFLEIAQQLTIGEGEFKQYGYVEIWPYMYLGSTQVFGVDVQDNNANPPDFDFAAATEMMTWYVNLIQVHEIQPLIIGSYLGDPVEYEGFETLLRDGRVAMWPGGGAGSTVLRNSTPLDYEVGVASLPLGPGGHQSVSPSAYFILADSPHREACWEWIKFLSLRPESVQPANSSTRSSWVRMLPARIETAESEAFVSQAGSAMADILYYAVSASPRADGGMIGSAFSGSLAWMNPGFNWLRDAYKEAATGTVSVTDALTDADIKFGQYRQCVIEQNAFDNTNLWSACILEVSPEADWLWMFGQ